MKWRWLIRRLMAMPPGEVMYRTRQAASGKLEKRRLQEISTSPLEEVLAEAFVLPAGAGSGAYEEQLLSHLRQRQTPAFFFNYRERERLAQEFRASFPEELERTIAVADLLAERQFQFFGHEVFLGDPIDWSRDHLTGRSWPKRYARAIDIRDTQSVGGIKYAWEPSRHLHWMSLARAYFLSGEEKYARELCAQWESWLDDNPPLIGIHWTSSLEMAIRIFVWSWCLQLLLPWERLSPHLVARALGSLLLQVRFIPRNFSLYSSANNHLIGEASGIAFAGILYPEFREAKRWRRQGLGILEREAARQIHRDGVSAEQATHYMPFILDLLLQGHLLAGKNGVAEADLGPGLERMLDFMGNLLDAQGNLPVIGDADDGEAVRLLEEHTRNVRSLLATGAALFERADFAEWSRGFDPKSWWLLGVDGKAQFNGLPGARAPRQSRAFRDGGYFVMRHGEGDTERLLIADCGPLGYGSLAAHGHADCLSFELRLGGEPILVDPGNYCYHENPEWRRYFRSTGAHNTLLVDDSDQSEMQGPFLWGRRASAELIRWESDPARDYLCGRHDGYQRPPIQGSHRRRILFIKPDTWLLVDHLDATGEHSWERRFHFSPGEVVSDPQTRQIIAERNGQKLTIAWPEEEPANLIAGSEKPILGWYSPSYGVKVPACCAVIEGKGSAPITLVTVLAAGEVPVLRRLSAVGAELALKLEFPDRQYTVSFDLSGGMSLITEESAVGV